MSLFFNTKCEKCRKFSQLMEPLKISEDKDIDDSRQVDVFSSSVNSHVLFKDKQNLVSPGQSRLSQRRSAKARTYSLKDRFGSPEKGWLGLFG